jgi:protocatechuate 3,4-dioxygenase, beta subunit
MSPFHIRQDRRTLLRSLLLTTSGIITAEVYAEALTLTPRMTEGPYYPDHLPLDQDNDLLRIQGNSADSAGVITEFGGRVLDAQGKPVADHQVEVWQADDNGCYIHSRGLQRGKERDPRFQGYGKIVTNAKGEYRFRTIKPGLYTGRTLHWHIAVNQGSKRLLTTQLFMAGVQQNDRDGLLNGIKDPAQRLSIIREFKPKSPDSTELLGTWDIVLGATPDERQMGQPKGQRQPRQRPEPTDSQLKEAFFGPSPFGG